MKTILVLLVSLPLLADAQPRRGAMMNGPAAGNAGNGSQPQTLTCDGTGPGAGAGLGQGRAQGGAGNGACLADGTGAAAGLRRGRGGMMRGAAGTCPLVVPAGIVTTLSAAQVTAVLDEERMAHDLYAVAAEAWPVRVFAAIAGAETRHTAAVEQLATSSKMAVPAAVTGSYATADIQNQYASLLPLMKQSETAALGAGALIEETDIAELRRTLATELDEGTRALLAQLETASRHHLAAFVRNLAARGVTYQPQVLTPDEFNAIIGG